MRRSKSPADSGNDQDGECSFPIVHVDFIYRSWYPLHEINDFLNVASVPKKTNSIISEI